MGQAPRRLVEVRAPPELRTTAVGLSLPGADTAVDVSGDAVDVPEVVEVCGLLVVEDVCAPPELLTAVVGLLVEVGDVPVFVDDVSDSVVVDSSVAPVDVDEVVEPASVGSAQAMPGTLATAAPTPRAAANSPTRPMYSAYCKTGCSLGSACVAGVPDGTHPLPVRPVTRRTSDCGGGLTPGTE